jgi:ABC-type uncharacterized transport system ATPase subunit
LWHYPNKLENAFKHKYSVAMGQKSQLFFELTPMDTFQLLKSLYPIPDDVYRGGFCHTAMLHICTQCLSQVGSMLANGCFGSWSFPHGQQARQFTAI